MKTDALIAMLAHHAEPVPARAVERRFALALLYSCPIAVVLMLTVFGLRADLMQATGTSTLWVKLGFAGGLALAAWVVAQRLGRPGVRVGGVWAAVATPLLLLWLLAATALLLAEPAQRPELIFGTTWKSCPFSLALLSAPLLAATLWAMKGLAPTRLRLAGASAGLLAGALSALVYALHCPESGVPFVAVWYVLGVALPTLAGAALGPRVLRW